MSEMINIEGLVPSNDPTKTYRYRMPRLLIKVEGKNTGTKTVLTNITQVSRALQRETEEIIKFFCYNLGVKTSFAKDPDRAIMSGTHSAKELQNRLKVYIEHFIVCSCCRSPDTNYSFKGSTLSLNCLSCGSMETINHNHNVACALTEFIIVRHRREKGLSKSADKLTQKALKREQKTGKVSIMQLDGNPSKTADRRISSPLLGGLRQETSEFDLQDHRVDAEEELDVADAVAAGKCLDQYS
jgi:translation initiation factor 5